LIFHPSLQRIVIVTKKKKENKKEGKKKIVPIRRGDSRTPHVQQVYNTSLTWVGPIMCGAHPM
jgi:hypothetical protein